MEKVKRFVFGVFFICLLFIYLLFFISEIHGHFSKRSEVDLYVDWLVGFVALRPKSTAMVIAGRSVHLTTLFLGRLEQAVNQ